MNFFRELPEIVRRTLLSIEEKAYALGYPIYIDNTALPEIIKEYADTLGINAVKAIGSILSSTFSGVVDILVGLMNIVLFPIFFFHVY